MPKKPPNKGDDPAEAEEGRSAAKGNIGKPPAPRTPRRDKRASMGLAGVREAARGGKKVRFTALLHHITPELLQQSFNALSRSAAPGVDGVTWRDYGEGFHERVQGLHREIHTGAYRARPSRRVFIPKADGRTRALGIAALEDKVVQQAVVTVLNHIYEADFLGFSYGFRQGRSQHDALDALTVGIKSQNVNWILDADIEAFFDEIDHDWMLKFLEHRIADKRIIALIRKWLKAGVIEDGRRTAATRGVPQGAVISPLLANIYLHLRPGSMEPAMAGPTGPGKDDRHTWTRRGLYAAIADDSVFGFKNAERCQTVPGRAAGTAGKVWAELEREEDATDRIWPIRGRQLPTTRTRQAPDV